jgi:hypothetical protein
MEANADRLNVAVEQEIGDFTQKLKKNPSSLFTSSSSTWILGA